MIGTHLTNILVSEALRTNGLVPFGFLDFTPVGLIVMVVETLSVTFVCIRLLAVDRSMNTFSDHLFGFLELRYTRYEKLSV